MKNIIHTLGLGGTRERYTQGETLWMTGLSVGVGFLLGIVVIIAIVA